MSYKLSWIELPMTVSDNLWYNTGFDMDGREGLTIALQQYHATYDIKKYTIEFESEAYYTMFILRWS